MDLSVINNSVEEVAGFVSILSTLLLILVIFVEKRIGSLSIGLLVFSLSESVSNVTITYLKAWSGPTADYGYAAWYLGWIVQYLLWIVLLIQFHRLLKIHLSNAVQLFGWYYLLAILIQAVDFIDRLTVDSGFFAPFYQLSTFVTTVSIVPAVGIIYWYELYKRRALVRMQEA